jgi:hypothetical protein
VSQALGQYRIGYGESEDGLTFNRLDSSAEAALNVSSSASAWDSLAVTYPYVFHHNSKRYMLYNGNEFGKTGFGLAIWRDE